MSTYTEKTYIVFLDIPDQISRKIDLIRERYSNTKLPYRAHLTLKQDEDFLIDDKKIVKIVSKTLMKQGPIRVRISKVNYKKNKQGWNFFFPVKSKLLARIVYDLSKTLEPFIDRNSPRAFISTKWEQSDEFYPHISIKGTSDKAEFTDLFQKIQNEKFNLELPLTFLCDHVTVAKWDRDKWKEIKTIKLQNVK
jgi:2'-5' RNA ligase